MRFVLVSGDPMEPCWSDVIAQFDSLRVGLPVPDGWRVLSGDLNASEIARIVLRYELELGEAERKAAFRACPILESYLATALEDLQLSDREEAHGEEREGRYSGTVYTLPDSEFRKAQAFCVAFMAEHAADIEAAGDLAPGKPGLQYARHGRWMDSERIGSTLYLASVGSGVTFTDDGNADCLERLAAAARDLRHESPYFGDDGLVYGVAR